MTTTFASTARVHLALATNDLDASMDFYRALFDQAPDPVHHDYARFVVANPPLQLSLNVTDAPLARSAVHHMGVQLADADQVAAAIDRLKSRGLEPRLELGTDCCYSKQDKAWVTDPDGHEWEIYTILSDPVVADTACGDAPGCCG